MARRKNSATVQFKLRMRESLRKRLERAAEDRRTSINNEIVERLELSFADDDAWGGAHTKGLLRLLQTIIGVVETHVGGRWVDRVETCEAVVHALAGAIGQRPMRMQGGSLLTEPGDVLIGRAVRTVLAAYRAPFIAEDDIGPTTRPLKGGTPQ